MQSNKTIIKTQIYNQVEDQVRNHLKQYKF